MGTPIEAFDDTGKQIWNRELNSNGKTIKETNTGFCNFTFQGQSYDAEIELAYNRFRYYDVEDGRYISQDPIGLAGGMTFYSYVGDSNMELDPLGLVTYHRKNGQFGKKRGRPKKKNTGHGNSVHSKKPRQHYVIVDENGIPYHGVGDTKGKRANQSLARLQEENPDRTFTIQSQTNYSNSMGAVKAEAQGIADTGGTISEGGANYNVNNSPGKPFI